MTNNPLQAAGNSRETPAANAAHNERRAFLFYTNWYDEIAISLTPEQQGEFLLTIVRYASTRTLPGEDVTPVVRTMFGLIRFVLDADLKKYDEIVEANKARAKVSADKRRSKIKTIMNQNLADEDEDPDFCAEKISAAIIQNKSEIVQTKSEIILPDADPFSDPFMPLDATPCAVDADNRTDAISSVDGGVETPAVDVFEAQEVMAHEPINNNQEPKNKNQKPAFLEKKEEEAHPRRDEVLAFWQEQHYESSVDDFWVYYEARRWTSNRGLPLRSWRRAAIMWEDKFRRVVKPLRRREAAAEAALTKEQQVAKLSLEREQHAAEAQRIRREQRISREEEADERAAKAVTPHLAAYMLARARQLCPANDEQAIDLLRRASDDAAIFAQLSKGYEPPS